MKRHLNLMTAHAHRRDLLQQRLRQWLPVLAVIAIVLSALSWWHWTGCRAVAARRQSLEAEYDPVKQLQSKVKALRGEINTLSHKESLALSLAQDRSPLTLLGQVSKAVKACEGSVYVKKLQLRTESTAAASGTVGQTHEAAPIKISIEGIGVSNVAVARFAASLRDAQLFETVELKATQTVVINATRARTFQLECGKH